MTKNKFLTILCIGLLLSNILLVGFMLLHKPGRSDKHGGPKEQIIKILALDDAQKQAYLAIVDTHHQSVRKQGQAIEELKNRLYLKLNKSDRDTATTDSLINQLGQMHRNIELTHFNHFADIKALCKPDQMDKYAKLTEELTRLFHKKKPK